WCSSRMANEYSHFGSSSLILRAWTCVLHTTDTRESSCERRKIAHGANVSETQPLAISNAPPGLTASHSPVYTGFSRRDRHSALCASCHSTRRSFGEPFGISEMSLI